MAVALAGGEGRGREASRCCFFMADANDAAGKFINMLIPLAAVFVEEEEEEGEAGRRRRRRGGGREEEGRRCAPLNRGRRIHRIDPSRPSARAKQK